MICVLQVVSPPLTTFLDPGPDIYLSTVVAPGGGTAVTCAVYAITPATQVVSAQLSINGNAQSFSSTPTPGSPMQLAFTVGNKPAVERTGTWNAINITVQDNTGDLTAFSTIWYIISGGGGLPTTTPAPPTTTPAPPTTTVHPLETARQAPAKTKKKGKR